MSGNEKSQCQPLTISVGKSFLQDNNSLVPWSNGGGGKSESSPPPLGEINPPPLLPPCRFKSESPAVELLEELKLFSAPEVGGAEEGGGGGGIDGGRLIGNGCSIEVSPPASRVKETWANVKSEFE